MCAGTPMNVNMSMWRGKAFVLKLTPNFRPFGGPNFDVDSWTATMRPTGAPIPPGVRIDGFDSFEQTRDRILREQHARNSEARVSIERELSNVITTTDRNRAQVIARTEAQRAVNAAKIADLQTSLPKFVEYVTGCDWAVRRHLDAFEAEYQRRAEPFKPDTRIVSMKEIRDSELMLPPYDPASHRLEFDIKMPLFDKKALMAHIEKALIDSVRMKRPLFQPEKEKPVKIRNRFYVAAASVTTNREQGQVNEPKNVHLSGPNNDGGRWTRPTLAAAVAHAQQILEDNPSQDHVAITQIVRIVRRKKAPVVVEVVR
jgi:hypothetical protein